MLQWSASIPPGGAPPFKGSCSLLRGPALATVAAEPLSKTRFHCLPLVFFFGEEIIHVPVSRSGLRGPYSAGFSSKLRGSPPLPLDDVCSVGTSKWAFWGEIRAGLHCKTTFSLILECFAS